MKILTVIKFKKAVHKNIHNNDDNDELIWKNDFLMPKSLISPKDIFTGSHQCRHHYRVGDKQDFKLCRTEFRLWWINFYRRDNHYIKIKKNQNHYQDINIFLKWFILSGIWTYLAWNMFAQIICLLTLLWKYKWLTEKSTKISLSNQVFWQRAFELYCLDLDRISYMFVALLNAVSVDITKIFDFSFVCLNAFTKQLEN